MDNNAPTLYEVLQATRDAGLVGEEDTVLTVVMAMLRGGLVVMTGPSRAGKDEVVDAAESAFNTDRMVYRWPVDDSETAAYYNRDEINQHPVHRFPDLARLEQHHEKILKAFGEGRDAERNRTDIAAEQRGGDAVEDQVIECPHTVIAFIASDNKNVNLNDYPELRNRALMLSVDASEQQTARVNKRKAMERAGRTTRNVDPMRLASIREYHSEIPVNTWTQQRGHKIVNPMAVEVHEQEPIPQKFPEARQDFDRLLEFMETVALYHHTDRMAVDRGSDEVLLVAPTDVWEAMTVLGNKMVMSALNLRTQDRGILDLLKESKAELTKADIQQNLRAQGFNIADDEVRRSLDSMRQKGYVRVHQASPNTFTFSEFGSVVSHDGGLDYEKIVESASIDVYDVVDDDAASDYEERFCTGDGLITTHPFNGEAVDITESDELEEMLESGVEDVKEMFGEAAYNDDGDRAPDPEPDDEDETQGTLV